MLFWMVVILGYRRQRNFERVFFFLCLALFFFYGGSLLSLNAQIYYVQPPAVLTAFSWSVLCIGLIFLPPLVLHLHLEYADTRLLAPSLTGRRFWLTAAYAPALYFGLRAYPILTSGKPFDFLTPSYSLGSAFELWFAIALGVSAYLEKKFADFAPDGEQLLFHRFLCGVLGGAALVFLSRVPGYFAADRTWMSTAVALLPILPLGALVYYVQKYNFLQIGRQQNLLYAVTVTFFALLYLSLVRRVGIWLEPVLPPEASAAILLFVLVVFIEPLQRILGRRLKETARQEMDQAQKVASVIHEVARQGNQKKLISFTEAWLKEKLELAEARLDLFESGSGSREEPAGEKEPGWLFPIESGERRIGVLRAKTHGAMLSGETRAALEYLCEQLPGALELCRLIEEKVRLERELAERERMAALGQMAASISHNLKNPLGSIKTILQVQLENPGLPKAIRGETQLVLEEIGRLSAKLNQLLQFSRPTVVGERAEAASDAAAAAIEVTSVLRHEAERRGVTLQFTESDAPVCVKASKEAVNDTLSNLVMNALEATPRGGHVSVKISRNGEECTLTVEDDGPGISPEIREKILQPFFTTKTQGTGLGLAIVARRVSEAGGSVDFVSPSKNGRGTRFSVQLPLGETKR